MAVCHSLMSPLFCSFCSHSVHQITRLLTAVTSLSALDKTELTLNYKVRMFRLKADTFNAITASHVSQIELLLILLMMLFTEYEKADMREVQSN